MNTLATNDTSYEVLRPYKKRRCHSPKDTSILYNLPIDCWSSVFEFADISIEQFLNVFCLIAKYYHNLQNNEMMWPTRFKNVVNVPAKCWQAMKKLNVTVQTAESFCMESTERYMDFKLQKFVSLHCISSHVITRLGHMHTLRHLDIFMNTSSRYAAIPTLASLSALKCFKLTLFKKIRNESLRYVTAVSHLLTHLYIDGTHSTVNDNGMQSLKQLHKLKELKLSNVFQITKHTMFAISMLQMLQSITLISCVRICDEGILCLSRCPKLQTLTINDSPLVTEFFMYIQAFSQLRELSLITMRIKDADVEWLCLPHLRMLEIKHAMCLTGTLTFKKMYQLTQLQILNLCCKNIKVETVHDITRCESLRKLQIYRCPNCLYQNYPYSIY